MSYGKKDKMFSRLSDRSKNVLQLLFVLGFSAIMMAIVFYLLSIKPVSGSRSVNFRVEASGGFSIITLQAGKLIISKPTTVTSPWQKTVQIPDGTEVYLTASNPTQTGKLKCSISIDQQPWQEETTNAPKDGVACAGIVP
ncbi:MAG: hypothetical protein NT121_11090 [Chloroflexi bacterium]|nr:hypothetical protein [Chloroflexota bacterium]